MIKNERQYRITRSQAAKFERALEQLAHQRSDEAGQIHPLLLKAQKEALRSQLADLRAQIEEYESLRSGQRQVVELDSCEELPRALIQARIASGLSQKELAQRLRLKEQQIQRYEATEYASASLARVLQVIRALDIQVRVLS
jgi:ribosome-binding protein aMBF1 (putative translation factor)